MEASIKVKSFAKTKKLKAVIISAIIIILMLIFAFPIILAVLTSLKTQAELSRSVFSLPGSFAFENYAEAIKKSNFTRSLLNSCIVTFPSVVLIVLCASMGGYTIARHSRTNRAFRVLDKLYLASLMLPFQILMIPVYKIFKTLKLQNSLFGMILILTGMSIAYASFLYVGFVKSIPKELEEAALIDGCGPYRAFYKIVFPLLSPITTTVAALHVMWLWNDFNIALILLQKEEVRTLTIKQYYFFGEHTTEFGMAFAASIMCMLPVLVFFVIAQKYLIEGITSGAVKN